MLTLLAKLLQALNSESSSRQIALAVALGFYFGLAPLASLHNIVILFIALFIRVHLSSFILSATFFSGISYLFSFALVGLGESLLTAPALAGLFTSLYQFDWFKLAHLHHTYTLGAFVFGLVMLLPIYFLSMRLVEKYRESFMATLERYRVVKALKASKFYRIYTSLSGQGV
ncbi:TIGR03546 family protein [Thalassotalea sp. LPB0316]|uniref:TIGR03546 family protein n=1 Tax=Thalassotalea sp. LPB0316 TaxID=2769490 RepID=UPI001866978A|nr:TIGR03546 family protein [Thalassotalea sp. LPB0316]QOL27043.1 TIGR03546 family protein [Thalassotalea sp. LPB0316]